MNTVAYAGFFLLQGGGFNHAGPEKADGGGGFRHFFFGLKMFGSIYLYIYLVSYVSIHLFIDLFIHLY